MADKKIKNKTYICDNCHQEFDSDWSDEEANQEAVDTFGKHPDDFKSGVSVVCDDCYNKYFNPEKSKDWLKEHKNDV